MRLVERQNSSPGACSNERTLCCASSVYAQSFMACPVSSDRTFRIAFICSARSAARRIHSSRVWGCVHQVGPDGGFTGGGGFFMASCNTNRIGIHCQANMSKAMSAAAAGSDGACGRQSDQPAQTRRRQAQPRKSPETAVGKNTCRQDKTLSVDSFHELVLTFLDRVAAGPLSASGFGAGVAARCARHPLPDVRL